ncbi:uncharacterized protein LOC116218795 [Clupea harengus]|uniref:Uncharacterized protein LOC116218795 n=1 Tax=Clupea harengus TaxID=7950 RepID=A0A6P8F2P6_CLUHA|nr:uncharacterized protein LOC116218795 [Clupea harengus]
MAPPAVTLVNVKTRNETHIELEWTKVNNINTYALKSSDEPETPITGLDGNTVTHTVSSLSAGTKYSFTLFTVLEELRSTGFEFPAVTAPPAVTLVIVKTRSETDIELEWTKVSDINPYTYILKRTGGTDTPIPGPAGNKVTHTVSSLSAGTEYSFTLFTVFEDARSTGHDFSEVTAPSNVALVNVKTRNETHIELEWTKVNNINTYALKSSDETETPITGLDGSTAVTHTVSSLSAGTKYSFTLFTVFEGVRSTGFEFPAVTGMSLFLIAKFQGSCFFSSQHLKTCVS